MSEPTPLDPAELLPADGEPQPLDGWRGADVDPSELVDDEWIAGHTHPLDLDALKGPGRYAATGAGWTRDTVRRVAARTGLPVVEAWSSHNRGSMGTVVAPLLHQTATAASAAGDYPTLRVVRDGRPGLENSLCMYGLGRSGTVYLISERLSWHAGEGSFGGVTDGNGHLAGIEAESDGRSWTPEQIDAYPRLVASILLETGRGAEWTPRHADYALPPGRKTDTSGLDIGALRAQVAHYLAHPEQINRNHTAPAQEDEMPPFVGFRNDPAKEGDGTRGDGEMVLAAPGYWIRVPGTGYPELYRWAGLVGEFRDVAPNQFRHFRDVLLSMPAPVGRLASLMTAMQVALADSSNLTPAELEAVVAKALRENVVAVDVEVRGRTAAAPAGLFTATWPDENPAGIDAEAWQAGGAL